MQLMLIGSWPGNFRRAIRDAAGNVARMIEFHPGDVYELTDEEVDAVRNDIGICLFPVAIDDRHGRHRPVNDPDAIRELNPRYLSAEPVAVPPTVTPSLAMAVDEDAVVDESVYDDPQASGAKRKKSK